MMMERIFFQLQMPESTSLVECLRLKINTNNRLVKNLFQKIINVDLKSILFERPINEVFKAYKKQLNEHD